MRRRPRVSAALAAALALAGGAASATPPGEGGARTLGMAGAIRGGATGAAAIFFNPAGLGLIHSSVVEGDFAYLPDRHGTVFSASAADSVTNSHVYAGIYYTHFALSDPAHLATGMPASATNSGHEAGLALATPVGSNLVLGETTKYLDASTVDPANTAIPRLIKDRVLTFDLAADVHTNGLSLALVGQNLLAPTGDLPRTLAAGLAVLPTQALLLDADASYDLSTGTSTTCSGSTPADTTCTAHGVRQWYAGGVEYLIAGMYSIRAGFQWDAARKAAYGALGVGVTTPKISLDIGAQREVAGGGETVLGVSLRLYPPVVTDEQAQQE